MRVKEIMTADVRVCRPDCSLAAAASKLRVRRCGVLPVVNDHGRIAGIVTDRDIAMAFETRTQPPAEIAVQEVMARDVAVCSPDDDLAKAMNVMAMRRVRRLPVVDEVGRVVGLVSLYDIAASASDAPGAASSFEAVGRLLRAVSGPEMARAVGSAAR